MLQVTSRYHISFPEVQREMIKFLRLDFLSTRWHGWMDKIKLLVSRVEQMRSETTEEKVN